MKKESKMFIATLAVVFSFGAVIPAKAFYVEIPQFLKNAINSMQTLNSSAQEASEFVKPMYPSSEMPKPELYTPNTPPPPPMMENIKYEGEQKSPMNNQMNQQPDGNKNFIQDIQRGAKQMERNLAQFDSLLNNTEKSGQTIKSEIKEKAEKLRTMIQKIKNAQSPQDLQDFDMGEANDISQELEQYRREIQEQGQRLKQVKQQIRNAEETVKSFEKQIGKVKDCVPAELKTKIETLKSTISTVKNAKTWDEVETAGLEDMGDIFDNLNESRSQLEVCARWPKILKQVDSQLKDLKKQVSKSKTLVDKLAKKNIDLSVVFGEFESGVAKMQAVRNEAVEKMKNNDTQVAMDLLQDDLFGQMDDMMRLQQTIAIMGNLGSFNTEFKRGLSEAQSKINSLKRKKMNTSELQSILAESKAKGLDILSQIKQKDADLDSIMESMEELQDLKMEFADKIAELTGEESDEIEQMMGASQFKQLQMPTDMNKFVGQPQSQKQEKSFEKVDGSESFKPLF